MRSKLPSSTNLEIRVDRIEPRVTKYTHSNSPVNHLRLTSMILINKTKSFDKTGTENEISKIENIYAFPKAL